MPDYDSWLEKPFQDRCDLEDFDEDLDAEELDCESETNEEE